jgi:2,4-diaminopentanoate dehydrogenase
MDRRLWVGHVGTGHTGALVLEQILRSPRLSLTGHLVHSPDKIGRDSGELVGMPPVGVLATDDLAEFLAVESDCVTYLPAVAGRDPDEVVEQLCAILATGKNVVTADIRMAFPRALDDASLTKLRSACAEGSSSFLGTGIAPGFATDVLPVHLASLTNAPTSIRVEERLPSGAFRGLGFFEHFGFGRTPEQDAHVYQPGAMIAHMTTPLALVADGLGWTLERIDEFRDVAVADRDYSFPAGPIAAGTIACVRMRFEGVVAGEPRLKFGFIWSLPDDPPDDWEPRIPPGSATGRLTRVTIEGNPTIRTELGIDGVLPGVEATAARVVNSIPAVCAAPPGVYGALDLVPRSVGVR